MSDRTYEQGYEDGESNQLADWTLALMDLLPDDVDCRPSAVAAYIRRLEELGDILAEGLQHLSDEFMRAGWIDHIEAWHRLRADNDGQADG